MMTFVMAFYDHYDGITIGFSGSKSRDRRICCQAQLQTMQGWCYIP